MFFVASKILGFLAAPSNLIVLLLILGFCLARTRWQKLARLCISFSTIALLLMGLGPASNLLMVPLENRFPPHVDLSINPTGIIVLAGSIDPHLSQHYSMPTIIDAPNRVFAAADLARRFPKARLIVSGGNGSPNTNARGESYYTRDLLVRLGIDRSRINVETRSRNTAESAAFTKGMIGVEANTDWLLVTSAYHMSRAVGCFRAAGVDVTAYPVGWTTTGWSGAFFPSPDVSYNLLIADHAVHEWIGLFVYWLTGRTWSLFPGPT